MSSILLALLWVAMFAVQEQYLQSKIETVVSKVRDTQHELHAAEVAHNLTRGTLVSTTDQLGICTSKLLEVEGNLQKSVSRNKEALSAILDLKELVTNLHMQNNEKSEALLELQEKMDRILCVAVWVALPLGILIIILMVTFSSFLIIHFCFR